MFRDGYDSQLATVTGSVDAGYTAELAVAVRASGPGEVALRGDLVGRLADDDRNHETVLERDLRVALCYAPCLARC